MVFYKLTTMYQRLIRVILEILVVLTIIYIIILQDVLIKRVFVRFLFYNNMVYNLFLIFRLALSNRSFILHYVF